MDLNLVLIYVADGGLLVKKSKEEEEVGEREALQDDEECYGCENLKGKKRNKSGNGGLKDLFEVSGEGIGGRKSKEK